MNAGSTKHRPKERRLNNASTHGVSFETKNTCSRLYTAPLKTFKTENTAYYIILRCLRIYRKPTSSSRIPYPYFHFLYNHAGSRRLYARSRQYAAAAPAYSGGSGPFVAWFPSSMNQNSETKPTDSFFDINPYIFMFYSCTVGVFKDIYWKKCRKQYIIFFIFPPLFLKV